MIGWRWGRLNQLDENQVRNFYEAVPSVWPDDDMWHMYSRKQIEKYIQKRIIRKDGYILNAGSGGNDYGINFRMHHVDIAKNKIEHLPNATVASIESLPFNNETFSEVICVGSVLNYCDAVTAIAEISRVLKKSGRLILEFENSWGFEHINTPAYKKDAEIALLNYCGQYQSQWLYSYNYISTILKGLGFKLVDIYRFHIISGLHYNKYHDENKAAPLAKLDGVFRYIPFVNKHSNNIILSCFKL